MRSRLAALSALAVGAALVAPALATGTAVPAAPLAGAAGAGQPVLLRDGLAGFDSLTGEILPIQADTTVEPSISVNPDDPLNAVTGFQVGRDDAGGDAANGFATTKDGGKTWVNGNIPGLTPATGGTYQRASDAVIAFGKGGLVYYSSLVFSAAGNGLAGPGNTSAIVNNTSHDGGLTWDAPTVVQANDLDGLNDKNWVIVDNGTGLGHHAGRVYVVWDRIAGLIAKYSDDQGKTWVPPSPIFTPNTYGGQGIGAFPMITPSGDLVVAFMADAAPPAVTGNPGEDLAEAVTGISKVTVTRFPGAGLVPTGAPLPQGISTGIATYEGNAVRHQRAGTLLAAAADPASGRIYVTWEDSRFRTDSNNDAVLAYSDNSGATWSAPVRVNNGLLNDQLDHYNPSVAVGNDGRVDVVWRQRQETASADVNTYSRQAHLFLARSTDGGQSFGAPLQLDTNANDIRFGAFSRGGLFQGDYDQVAISGDLTYVVRCEAYAPSPTAKAPATPSASTLHHQTTWVAVVGPAPAG